MLAAFVAALGQYPAASAQGRHLAFLPGGRRLK